MAFLLSSIGIIGGPGLTNERPKFSSNMKKINQITISDGNFTDMGLRHIKGLQLLNYLSIAPASACSNAAISASTIICPTLGIVV